MKISQKDAVYSVTIETLNENNISFEEGIDCMSSVVDKDIRNTIVEKLLNLFENNKVIVNKQQEDSDLKRYVSGLVSNWAKKDDRLNGGVKHEIKNPGSKLGSTDPVIVELRKMLKEVKGTVYENDVKKELTRRMNEIKKKKMSTSNINASLIPDSLKHLIGGNHVTQ